MTDHTELKTAIEYILNQGALEREFIEDADALDAAWAVYEALGPTDILALIADIEDARNGMKHSCAIRLKKRIELLETQRDQLIADNERLTKAVGLQVIRRFVGDDDQKNIDELVAAGIQVDKELIVQLKAENERLAAACERAEQIIIVECKAASLAKVRANLLEANRDQLRAEVAGLKTGYEAYEQVNAELKAEVEALRRVTGNRYAPPRAHLTGPSKCLSCGEIHYGMGGLPCPNMRITAQADLPETLSGQIGAALGQGELS